MLFDVHNHLQKFAEPADIIREAKLAGVTGCVVNGTSEADWRDVAELAIRFPDFVRPAFGLHPWFAKDRSPMWLDKLSELLDQFPTASIGECGVDQWMKDADIADQLEVFLPQLRLARERDIAITVHALKAWEPLFEALSAEPVSTRGFLLHSFGGSPELVERLVPLGAHFSCSGYFLHPRKAKVLTAYRQVPKGRLLIETDAPEMLPPDDVITHALPNLENHPANLPSIQRVLAQRLDMDLHELGESTSSAALSLFGEPPSACLF